MELISTIEEGLSWGWRHVNGVSQRIIVLDEFHRLKPEAQEKFVKVIEDSGDDTLFVLCVAANADINEAIAQRTVPRRIALPSLAASTRHTRIVARAEGKILSCGDAELIATTARCIPRVYLSILQDALILSGPDHDVSHDIVVTTCDAFDPDQSGALT